MCRSTRSCRTHDFCTGTKRRMPELQTGALRGPARASRQHTSLEPAFIAALDDWLHQGERDASMSEIAKEVGLPEPLELTDAEISASRPGSQVERTPPPHALNGTPGDG